MDLNAIWAKTGATLTRLPLREGVDLNLRANNNPELRNGLPLREGVDLNKTTDVALEAKAVSLCVREWI